MKSRILLMVLALMCLIDSVTLVSAGQETRLTNDQFLVHGLTINGNLVSWGRDNTPMVYNLTTRNYLTFIHNDSIGLGDVWHEPRVYGNKIITMDDNREIVLIDGSSGVVSQLWINSEYPYTLTGDSQDIYGNNIVYQDNGVCLYNLDTRSVTHVTGYADAYFNCNIYGNKIVWSRENTQTHKTDAYVYDIPSRKISSLSTSGYAGNPKISGNIVVWSDLHNGKRDIFMRDISKGKTTQITSTGISDEPAISGNRIVYSNSRRVSDIKTTDIYLYEISTGKTTQITTSGCAWCPAIYNDKIVYFDSRSFGVYNWEAGDVYLYDLSAKGTKPTATFTVDKTSGIAPLSVQFSSTTTGNPTDYYWVFEPSTSSDWNSHHAVTAAHTFKKPGTYTISLTVTNGAGSTTVTEKNYITVTAPATKPAAIFSASPSSGKAPLKVQFTDKSAGTPTSWKWTFGDGTTSTTKSPTHTYTKKGKFAVTLTVNNEAGSNTKTMTNYITVN